VIDVDQQQRALEAAGLARLRHHRLEVTAVRQVRQRVALALRLQLDMARGEPPVGLARRA